MSWLSECVDLTPEVKHKLAIEPGVEYCGVGSLMGTPKITNLARIQLHHLLVLVWASGAEKCELFTNKYGTTLTWQNPHGIWCTVPLEYNPFDLPTDNSTIVVECPPWA